MSTDRSRNPFLLCFPAASRRRNEMGGVADPLAPKMATNRGIRKSPSSGVDLALSPPGTSKHRDLLSVQLEITERLLEAEERKLSALKAELSSADTRGPVGTGKAKELELQQSAYMRIRAQFDRLSRELSEATVVAINNKKPLRHSRSLPAIGIKPVVKRRPSLYNILDQSNEEDISENGDNPVFDEVVKGEGPGYYPAVESSPIAGLALSKDLEGVVIRDGVLVSGTLDDLIQLLQPTAKHHPDRTFLFAFILCARLYTRPHNILSRIVKNADLPQLHQHNHVDVSQATNFVQMLCDWTELFPYDFRDERMMRELRDITKKLSTLSVDLKKSCGTLIQGLIQKLSVLDKYEQVLTEVNDLTIQCMSASSMPINVRALCDDSVRMAQQLTHIEMERMNHIGPEEFIQTFVKENSNEDYYDIKKTTNIEAYVEWFNRFSSLVATEICMSDKKQRHRVLEFFLDVALECVKLNNFNSFMAIAAATSMTPVARLKKTISKVPQHKLHEVEHLMDPCSNFSVYRSQLASVLRLDRPGCVVPFFSLFIKDIYFLNEGIKNRTVDGTVNFEKCWALSRHVTQFLSWKDTAVQFPRLPEVLRYLMTNPVMNEDELLLSSYDCEPPDNDFEKRRQKELLKDKFPSGSTKFKRSSVVSN